MKIIIGNPGSGKTKKILQLSADKNIPILCESEARQERLLVKARGYGYSIPRPVVYTEAQGLSCVYVDDVKRLLEAMFNLELKGITINVESEDELEKI